MNEKFEKFFQKRKELKVKKIALERELLEREYALYQRRSAERKAKFIAFKKNVKVTAKTLVEKILG